MNFVLDSNVLFSALIKNSLTRRLILRYEGKFLFPEFIFEEIIHHKEEISSKAGLEEKEFNLLLGLLLEKVVVVSTKELLPYKEEALAIVKDIDLDDIQFVACALAYPGSIIWSNDEKLKQQDKVRVLNTSEIIGIL